MFRVIETRPVAPLSLAEARRILTDIDFAMRFDPMTRAQAFRVCQSARRGTSCPVLVMVSGLVAIYTPEPPKDAA